MGDLIFIFDNTMLKFTLRKIKSARFYLSQFMFHRLAIPKVSNEHISKRMIKRHLPTNPVMLDCGAHEGKDSFDLLKCFGGSIHSFEPVPELFEKLKKKMQGIKNSYTYPIALSDVNGINEFYVSEGKSDGSSSLLAPKDHLISHPDTFFRKKVMVETKTLDSWAATHRIEKIDLLWLDMQGFEMNMLLASKKIFNSVKVIHTEVSTRETYEGVHLYKEYRDFLIENGFDVIIEAIPNGWDMGNVLFVKKHTNGNSDS